MPQSLAHFGEYQFWLVTQAEQRLCATELFSGSRNLQDLVGRHCMRTRLPRIAPECAIAAIVPAQICKWNKNFSRVRDQAWLEPLAGGARGSEQLRQFCVTGPNAAVATVAGDWRNQSLATMSLAKLPHPRFDVCRRTWH
jgi:hypothetical protein